MQVKLNEPKRKFKKQISPANCEASSKSISEHNKVNIFFIVKQDDFENHPILENY